MPNDESGRKSRRFVERRPVSLPVRVRCRESLTEEWEENAKLLDASLSGARLSLTHSTEAGQLLHLRLPLPRSMRRFDYTKTDYCVWGVVRRVLALACAEANTQQFEVGVAFIGQSPPARFESHPQTRYDLLPMPSKSGFWALRERPRSQNSDENTYLRTPAHHV